jgi:hypothetical protein
MECAVTLGVSQQAMENEYYFIDLPQVMEAHRREKAQHAILSLQIASSPYMEKDDYKAFFDGLREEAGRSDEDDDTFDEEGLDKVRMMLARRG